MKRACLIWGLLICSFVFSSAPTAADGKVFRQIFAERVETPNQQALIHFSEGAEDLVIETTVLGAGTNFAWVVPLPAPPEIAPVSEDFFTNLGRTFRSRLIHKPPPIYFAALFLCGLSFLGWRSMKDDVSSAMDFPLCVLLSGAAWYFGKHIFFGVMALGLTAYVRVWTRSPMNWGVAMLVGFALMAWITFIHEPSLAALDSVIVYLGSEEEDRGVTVISKQRAGVFDTATIQGSSPAAVAEWLDRNGFEMPKSAEPALRYYVDHGWVFVASKVRRDSADQKHSALHPLAFKFATKDPIYPMRLTGVENSDCSVDLFVFGKERGVARDFHVVRCDRVAIRTEGKSGPSWLRVSDTEIWNVIGDATVGTKLTAKLTPAQMASDVKIGSEQFRSQRETVYSRQGAGLTALNIAGPIGAAGWMLLGASRGGWKTDEKKIAIWRWRFLSFVVSVGLLVFLLLPKVEVMAVN
jgi:hypothetical protein